MDKGGNYATLRPSSMSSPDGQQYSWTSEERWGRLVAWLKVKGMNVSEDFPVVCKPSRGAGNGLFATHPISTGTPLFSIPAEALMNAKTLRSHYCQDIASLTGAQVISLHLFLHLPLAPSMDPLFGPYISVLPRNFDSHPITWLVQRDILKNHQSKFARLLDHLTPSVTRSLNAAAQKFWGDWLAVHAWIVANRRTFAQWCGPELPSIDLHDATTITDYLRAWLNVNTRCIYYRIKPSPEDSGNVTLCPVVDFANHTRMSPQISPAVSATVAGGDFIVVSCPGKSIQAGDELFLTYGRHANRTLFVEYGFIDISEDDGEVDVQDLVEPLIEAKGHGMQEILIKAGYWGDWTLHSGPGPAHPSFRLITALRLYALNPLLSEDIQMWRDTLIGKRYIISEQNEQAWRATLSNICESIIQRAQNRAKLGVEGDSEMSVVCGNIESLWKEEWYVATNVLESLRAGEEF